MVTEKNAGSSHDFLKDPIRLLVEGDWLTADGTTLGADNGMGVSAALALLDCKKAPRPPFLLTVALPSSNNTYMRSWYSVVVVVVAVLPSVFVASVGPIVYKTPSEGKNGEVCCTRQ